MISGIIYADEEIDYKAFSIIETVTYTNITPPITLTNVATVIITGKIQEPTSMHLDGPSNAVFLVRMQIITPEELAGKMLHINRKWFPKNIPEKEGVIIEFKAPSMAIYGSDDLLMLVSGEMSFIGEVKEIESNQNLQPTPLNAGQAGQTNKAESAEI